MARTMDNATIEQRLIDILAQFARATSQLEMLMDKHSKLTDVVRQVQSIVDEIQRQDDLQEERLAQLEEATAEMTTAIQQTTESSKLLRRWVLMAILTLGVSIGFLGAENILPRLISFISAF